MTNAKVQDLVKFIPIPQRAAVNESLARQLANDWFDAWNRHNLDAIMSHYAEDVEFTSPFVLRLLNGSDGAIHGKLALRDYFARALAAYPQLRFTDLNVLTGVNSLTLHYRSINDLMAAEVMTLDPAGRIIRVMAHYAPASSPSLIARQGAVHEWRQGEYLLTDDPARIDLDAICTLLQSTYWANDRPCEAIEKSIRHSTSLCLLHDGRLAGFIRGVTDHATFTWVCDVIIHPDHRDRGLGKWMVKCFLKHPGLQTISHHLCTKDAHGLYESLGFKRIEAMRRSEREMPFLLV